MKALRNTSAVKNYVHMYSGGKNNVHNRGIKLMLIEEEFQKHIYQAETLNWNYKDKTLLNTDNIKPQYQNNLLTENQLKELMSKKEEWNSSDCLSWFITTMTETINKNREYIRTTWTASRWRKWQNRKKFIPDFRF